MKADVGIESHDENGKKNVEFGIGTGVVEVNRRDAIFRESRVDQNVADLFAPLGH